MSLRVCVSERESGAALRNGDVWGRWFSRNAGRRGQLSPRTILDVGLCTLARRGVPGAQIRGAVFPSFIYSIACGLPHQEGGPHSVISIQFMLKMACFFHISSYFVLPRIVFNPC